MRSSEILLQQLVAQLVDEISSTVAQRVHDRLNAKDAELQKLRDRVALLEEKVDSLETQDVPAETGQSAKPVDGEHVRRYLTISEVAELLSIHEQTLHGYKIRRSPGTQARRLAHNPSFTGGVRAVR